MITKEKTKEAKTKVNQNHPANTTAKIKAKAVTNPTTHHVTQHPPLKNEALHLVGRKIAHSALTSPKAAARKVKSVISTTYPYAPTGKGTVARLGNDVASYM